MNKSNVYKDRTLQVKYICKKNFCLSIFKEPR